MLDIDDFLFLKTKLVFYFLLAFCSVRREYPLSFLGSIFHLYDFICIISFDSLLCFKCNRI